MGETSTTILEDMIRQALIEEGVSLPDSQPVPTDFDFKKVSIDVKEPVKFRLKVFKKTLEEIIRKLETHDDLQTFPEASLTTIKRGLNDVSNGFYALLESREPKITKDDERKINEVHDPLLMEAQALIYGAATEFSKQGQTDEYYLKLLKCRKKMFQIKLLLKTWD